MPQHSITVFAGNLFQYGIQFISRKFNHAAVGQVDNMVVVPFVYGLFINRLLMGKLVFLNQSSFTQRIESPIDGCLLYTSDAADEL